MARYVVRNTAEVSERLRAFNGYYALLRQYIDKGLIKSSLDRGAFTHPKQILDKEVRDLLGESRHRISIGYGPEAGEPALRSTIAQLENLRHGTQYSEENIVIVAGAWCGVEMVFEEISNKTGSGFKKIRIASIGPTHYQLFQRPIEVFGAEVIAFDFINFEGSTPQTEQEVDDIISSKPDVVFVTNPNNPNGEYFPAPLLEYLVEESSKAGVYLVIDEMQNFLPIPNAGLQYGPWIQQPHVIRIDSYSKHFALAEYRTGWIIADNKLVGNRYEGLISRIRGVMGNGPRAANDALILLMERQIASFRTPIPSSSKWQSLLNKEDYIIKTLSKIKGVELMPRQGCFNVCLRVKGFATDIEFAERLMKVGTLMMPCEGYGYRTEDSVMRITFAERWKKIRHGIAAFKEVIET